MSMGRVFGLSRSAALALGLALAAAVTLDAQDAKTREPKRPKLDAGRDTNSAGAYHQHGMLHLAKRPKEYDLAAQLAPDRADIRYVYGVLLMARQKFEDAAEQFRLAVEADPYFAKPYLPLAYLREGQGKDSLAIVYYTQFVALAPAVYARQVEDARQRLGEVKRLFSESH